MIAVEVECYFLKRAKEDRLVSSHRVLPGAWKGIEFLGKDTKVAVFCSDGGAAVFIKAKPKRRIDIIKFENEGDKKGRLEYPNASINLAKGQEMSISTRKGRKKVIDIYVSDDDTEEDGFKKDPSIEDPIDSPNNPKVPVSV